MQRVFSYVVAILHRALSANRHPMTRNKPAATRQGYPNTCVVAILHRALSANRQPMTRNKPAATRQGYPNTCVVAILYCVIETRRYRSYWGRDEPTGCSVVEYRGYL